MRPIHCPFCGSENIYLGEFKELMEESSNFGYAGEKITCKDCGATISEPRPYEFNDPDYWDYHDRVKIMAIRESLIKKWNKRHK